VQKPWVATSREPYIPPKIPNFKNPDTPADIATESATAAAPKESQLPTRPIHSTSISAIASDGRRPPETAKPKVLISNISDAIRFTTGGSGTAKKNRPNPKEDHESTPNARKAPKMNRNAPATTGGPSANARKTPQDTRRADKAESQANVTLKEANETIARLKDEAKAKDKQPKEQEKEFKTKLSHKAAELKSYEEKSEGHRRTSSGDSHSSRNPYVDRYSRRSFNSQISFVSQVESEEKEKQKAEKERQEKYEKEKASYRRRTERDIRGVLSGQGVEQIEEKVMKQVNERVVAWEVC
jgi:hypothetical protein